MSEKEHKSWKKNLTKNLKKIKPILQDCKNEISRGLLTAKLSNKLAEKLNEINENIKVSPSKELSTNLSIANSLLSIFESIIDILCKVKYDKNINTYFEMMYTLITFEGFQPYQYQSFPPPNLSKELSNLYCSYYLCLLKTNLMILLLLKQSKDLENVKNIKDKVKVKKLISFQISMDIPEIEEEQYPILGKILSALSLRNQSLLKDIIESITTKIIATGTNVRIVTLWKSFGEYCINTNTSCKHYADGLKGIDLKWTLHFSAYLPLSFQFYIAYLYDLKNYHSLCQFEDNQYPGYSNISQFITHLSHIGTSKISDIQAFHKTEAILTTFSIPNRLNEIFYDKVKRINTRSVDSICIFIVSMTHIFKEFNEKQIVIDEIDVNVIIKTFDVIFDIDSFYAQTAMFSMLYELLPILHKSKRKILIDYLIDNFDFYALHWYYQARNYFFLLIILRLTIAPSFRIYGQLLPEEQQIYNTYADLEYDRNITSIVTEKIELIKQYANGTKELPMHLEKKKPYLVHVVNEINIVEKIRGDWVWENTFEPEIKHLELSKVSMFDEKSSYY